MSILSSRSSSDSDSDPEGGELPDIPYQKEEEPSQKKKLKKKRSDKIAEERLQKSVRKREVSHRRERESDRLHESILIPIIYKTLHPSYPYLG